MQGFGSRIVAAAMGAIVGAFAASAAIAQSELKIMAPAGPGGGWDQTARAMQGALIQSGLIRSVQVTNVGGAGGTVGLAQLINGARGDGNQLMVNGLVMLGAILTNRSPVQLDQATPIARLTSEDLVIVVPTNSPLKDVRELVTRLKAEPGRVRWAGGSAGGVDHLAAGLVAKTVGADATKINYIAFSGGGEALAAVLGGRVTVGISGYGEFEGQIKAGKLRILAITSGERIAGIDAPTLKESGVDLVVANWRSVFAPPGITPEARAQLIDTVTKLVKTKEWAEVLKAKGWDDDFLAGDEFAAFLKSEQARVRDILTSIGLVESAYGLGPTIMPWVVGTGLALLVLGVGIERVRAGPVSRESLDAKPLVLIVGGLAVLIASIGLGGGFIPGVAILFAATAAAFGRRAVATDLGIGLVLGIGIYLLFAKLLSLSLPIGPIERLI